ncbi:hypothetical protein LCGC14_1905170 [marine sediment metagenome]|uniref:Uncharacterized protein n=1 Tax=marine sediment metagenome TaxID=412755 RepID=A0A0F9I9B1_9ZZZZ
MNKKTIAIVSVLLGILLIGVISASLLTYFGKITGSVEVSAPVFYATDIHIQGDVPTVIYAMSTNEVPDNNTAFNLTDGENIIFATDSLGVESFYPPRFDFNIKAKTNNESGRDLFIEFWTTNENYEYKDKICETKITLTNTINYANKGGSCSDSSELNLNPSDRFAMKISGSGMDSWYSIRIGGPYTPDKTTHMRVTAT